MNIVLISFAIFGALGMLAVISALAYFFTSFGKNVSVLAVDCKLHPLGSTPFLQSLATISGGVPVSVSDAECEVFSDNEDFFAHLIKMINTADTTIAITTYVWEEGDTTKQLFAALREAAARDVKIYLLLDAFGSSVTDTYLKQLTTAGINVACFRPFKIGQLSTYHSRSHRRMYIFDGKTTYIGGSAVSDKWFTNTSKNITDSFVYHDVMYQITGSAVGCMMGTFGELWSATSSILPQLGADLVYEPNEKVNAVYLAHSPRVDIHPFTYYLWYSIMAAKETIVICSPYFVPGRVVNDVLKRKACTGVKITIITQGTSELWFVQAAGRSYYKELLEVGIRIFEHQVPHLHSKIVVIDNAFSIIGSANIDVRSQRINHENVLGVYSSQMATMNTQLINSYLSESKEMSLDDWQKRPFWRGLFEKCVHSVSEQL